MHLPVHLHGLVGASLPLPLASELRERSLWNPTILGVLVVVAGVVLFCGSIYLLLGTNLGARLGFLVAFTGLMGFMVILTLLWITTASPLNTLRGRIPEWRVEEVVEDLAEARIPEVRDIQRPQKVADVTEAANVKAAVDDALVPKVGTPTDPLEEGDNEFAIPEFDDVTRFLIENTYEVGGSSPQFWELEFTHVPHYAVAQFCEVSRAPEDRPAVLPPLPPECAPDGIRGFVVLSRELGSVRVPPFVAFGMASLLFGLGLLMLHWREKDERELAAQREPARPTPVPAKV